MIDAEKQDGIDLYAEHEGIGLNPGAIETKPGTSTGGKIDVDLSLGQVWATR